MNEGIGELGHKAGGGDDCKMQNAKRATIRQYGKPLELRHSERSEESSLRRNSGKILAALRMTVIALRMTVALH